MRELHCNSHNGKPKRYFHTQAMAEDWIRDNRQQEHLKAFDCPDCDGWHLTTRYKPWETRRRVRRGR